MITHLDLLPETTKKLWLELRDEPLLAGGILIGGTALALRIGHRQRCPKIGRKLMRF